MTDTPDHRTPEDRARPTPRPRPGAAPRPSPRPRVAGARRERDEAEATPRTARPAPTTRSAPAPRASARTTTEQPVAPARSGGSVPARAVAAGTAPRRFPALAAVLAVLCLAAAAGTGWLVWDRLHPRSVDSTVFTAARDGVQALYAFDYHDPDGSVRRKLSVLTGDLHDRYKTDLAQGGIIDTYKQVSATTSYEVRDVGLQQINDAQDTATLVVFGRTVVKSVNSGTKPAPADSECQVTPQGAQACTQTLQVGVTKVDGEWKIDDFTVLTTS